jgi:uroporphyrin-III C-methyltransferase
MSRPTGQNPGINNRNSPGKVFLIGAGPGDIELLTLKAVRVLALADVILLDELVNPAVLDFVKESAEIVKVGKRGGRKSTEQDEIHHLMIAFARAGRCVARVKGGDPFIFGRGGEEIEALKQAGIAVEVVSGVTAGIAVPASVGIPLSHRDHAHSVVFVTGHNKPDGEQPNWRALAESGSTLVIYMGLTNLAFIAEKLIESGLSSTTSACVIENGTLAEQRSVVAPLIQLVQKAKELEFRSPAIIVIGEVVGLAGDSEALVPEVAGDSMMVETRR